MIENRPELVEEARLARRHRLAHAAAAAGAMVALCSSTSSLGLRRSRSGGRLP